nr:helix-turn-helix domain-containing protein [Streptomyces sp. MNP-20]
MLTTAVAWLDCDAHLEPTARLLGMAEGTVRSHLRALETHMSRDLTSLSGMRDLALALHIIRGESTAAVGCRELCAAA